MSERTGCWRTREIAYFSVLENEVAERKSLWGRKIWKFEIAVECLPVFDSKVAESKSRLGGTGKIKAPTIYIYLPFLNV